MQKIMTFLWFDNQAEEAVNHYISIFKDSRITQVMRAGPEASNSVMTIRFELAGQQFVALNGGPVHRFTEAISLYVDCASQSEVDELWTRLGEGGQKGPCGWLKDRYGLSWQIVPRRLIELLADRDPVKAGRVMNSMMGMEKIEIGELERAYDSAGS